METISKSTSPKSRSVYRQREYQTYLLWKSLPTYLRGKPEPILRKAGIDDEEILELLQIKTQTAFAERFAIKDLGTLTDWNKRIEHEGLLLGIYIWTRRLSPNVIFALYQRASTQGRAQDVKAWFELVEHV